jgi:hypothetical protein
MFTSFGLAVPFCIGGVLLLIGVGLVAFAARNQRRADESKAWPTSQGRILESKLVESTSTDSDGMESTSYTPTVRYSYEVAGKTYESDRLNRGAAMGLGLGAARNIVGRYPAGATATVHYNPDSPAEAALETTAQGGTVLRIMGILLVVLGVLCAATGLIAPLTSRLLHGFLGF